VKRCALGGAARDGLGTLNDLGVGSVADEVRYQSIPKAVFCDI
jgi:hypothetical protein